MPHQSHPPWFDRPNNILRCVQGMKLLIMRSSPAFLHLGPNSLFSTLPSNTLSLCSVSTLSTPNSSFPRNKTSVEWFPQCRITINPNRAPLITSTLIRKFAPTKYRPFVAWCNCLRVLEHWDRGLKFHSRHECVSAFICAVLSCVWVEALRRADPPSKESYQLSNRFISLR